MTRLLESILQRTGQLGCLRWRGRRRREIENRNHRSVFPPSSPWPKKRDISARLTRPGTSAGALAYGRATTEVGLWPTSPGACRTSRCRSRTGSLRYLSATRSRPQYSSTRSFF